MGPLAPALHDVVFEINFQPSAVVCGYCFFSVWISLTFSGAYLSPPLPVRRANGRQRTPCGCQRALIYTRRPRSSRVARKRSRDGGTFSDLSCLSLYMLFGLSGQRGTAAYSLPYSPWSCFFFFRQLPTLIVSLDGHCLICSGEVCRGGSEFPRIVPGGAPRWAHSLLQG